MPALLKLPPPFEDAIARHEREIMRYILRMSGNRDDALDLFQETWLRAYRSYPSLQSENGLRPWLFRIAGNLCRNRARDNARRSRVMAPADSDLDSRAHSGSAKHDSAETLHLRRMIANLPRSQREALIMRKFSGLSYAEIGEALDCSEESARASVYQALKKIKAGR